MGGLGAGLATQFVGSSASTGLLFKHYSEFQDGDTRDKQGPLLSVESCRIYVHEASPASDISVPLTRIQ